MLTDWWDPTTPWWWASTSSRDTCSRRGSGCERCTALLTLASGAPPLASLWDYHRESGRDAEKDRSCHVNRLWWVIQLGLFWCSVTKQQHHFIKTLSYNWQKTINKVKNQLLLIINCVYSKNNPNISWDLFILVQESSFCFFLHNVIYMSQADK